jgi:peptidoglycan/xylan/chitin deacetylase (PgdA/CDA1 family)
MNRRWLPWLLAVGLAALAAGLTAGLARGAAYGRYVAAQALIERRTAAIDGLIDGLRPAADAPLLGVAYAGGHYYPTEPPLLTWLAAPLYALGALPAAAWPGVGWGPALVGLLGPLLVLATLLGAARLARQVRDDPAAAAVVVLAVGLGLPLLPAAGGGSPWLLAAALVCWLLVGQTWSSRQGAVAHGLVAGALAGSFPALAPAALVALASGRGWWLARAAGLAPPLLLIGGWQWLVFGRPWRLAGQFALVAGEGAPPVALLATAGLALVAVALIVVLAPHNPPTPEGTDGADASGSGGEGRGGRAERWWLGGGALLVVLGTLAPWLGPAGDRRPVLAGVLALGLALLAGRLAGAPAAVRRLALGAVALLALAGAADPAWRAGPVLLAYEAPQRLALAGLVALAGAAVWLAARRPRLAGLLPAPAVALVALGLAVAGRPALAADTGAGRTLIPPFVAPAPAGGPPLALWRLAGGARLEGERLRLPDVQALAESPVVAARPGERYCAAAGPAVGQVVLVWEDDAKRAVAQHGGQGAQARLCFAAPPGATGVRLRLTGGAGPSQVEQAALWADSVRLAPLPDFATAALAFTFDWESAMGGLIHSKGGSAGYEGEAGGPAREEESDPLAVAVARGARMRRGAEVLADLFRPYGIRATFYATGYNLLTGNPDRRSFAGDPTYRWAGRRNGWASDYWTTHRWYGDDPYGTEATHPEWYYGSLTRRLAAEGHEIETHTFGHLYVRGTTPEELARDLDEWNAAARALGLPPARSFAFPWRSSNSVRTPHFSRLTEAGIGSITRVYRVRPGYEYELDAVEDAPGLLIYPDLLLASTEASGLAARRAIDETLLRRGYQSLWTHPEEVVDPPQVAVWRGVIAYAAAARDRGLWVAPLVEIVERVRAGRQVEVVVLRDGGVTRLWLTNTGDGALGGTVVELGALGPIRLAEDAAGEQRGERVRLPLLGPRQPAALAVATGVAER